MTLAELIEKLTNLKALYLSDNQLTSIPNEISQLTNLTYFYLSGNRTTSL